MPKMIAARARVAQKINNVYRAAGYDGPEIKFDNPYTGAANTEQDDALKSTLKKPTLSFDDVFAKELSDRQIAAGKENGLDVTSNPADQALYRDAYQAAQSKYHPEASPRQQERIAGLSAVASGDDKAAESARIDLRTIIEKGETPKLRELARAALESSLRAKGSTEQTTMATGRTGPLPPPPAGQTYAPPPVPDELRLR
jgi:hypothetical protein